MALQLQQNMGITDRVVRGLLGSVMLVNGLRHLGNSKVRKVEAAVGGAFLTYGITGFDPLLSAFGATTIAGTENNVFNQLRAALPGQGIKPALTQFVKPKKQVKPFNERTTLSEALSIG